MSLSSLGAISSERDARLRDHRSGPSRAEASWEQELSLAPASIDREQIAAARAFAGAIDREQAPFAFVHPLRVAKLVLDLDPRPVTDAVIIALLHSALERPGAVAADLRERFGVAMSTVVTDLTPDRSQAAPEYFERYYARIRAGHRTGRVVKVLDKLDNLCN